MDKLPCPTSFLMSINFDGLKEVTEFFHKNINSLNEKIKDLNLRFKGYEEMQNQLKENKIKTESGLRLLKELEERLNNFSQNIMDNSQKIENNKEKYNDIKEEIEKMKLDNQNNLNEIKNLLSNSNQNNKEDIQPIHYENNQFQEEIQKIKNENNNNFEKVFSKIEILESDINSIKEREKFEQNNKIIDNNKENENNENSKEEEKKVNMEGIVLYNSLSKKVDKLEENVNKILNDLSKKEEIIPLNINKVSEIKESSLSNAGNKLIEKDGKSEFELHIDEKLNDISNKIIKIESDIFDIKKNNIKNKFDNNNNIINDINQNQYTNIIEKNDNNENIINNNYVEKNNEEKNEEKIADIQQEEQKENKENLLNKYNLIDSKIIEIVDHINKINNKLASDEFLKNADFRKFSQKLDLQLQNYNSTINKILSKHPSKNSLFEKIPYTNNIMKNNEDDENEEEKNKNNSLKNSQLLSSIESNTRTMIEEYLKKLDISNNPIILKHKKDLEEKTNLITILTEKIDSMKAENKEKNKNFLNLLEKAKYDFYSNLKNIEKEVGSISSLNDEIDFCKSIILGKEEEEKYKNMTKEEKKNELSVNSSIKEEIVMHGNYLKKLSEGINKVNNRLSNLNKENLAAIKRDLKNESNFILEDFKVGLKDSISKIETKLRDKVDKLGLDQFWNKINEQLIEEMKNKIDKKEMNKNNMYLKKR